MVRGNYQESIRVGKIFCLSGWTWGAAAENPSTANGPPPLSGEAFWVQNLKKAPLKMYLTMFNATEDAINKGGYRFFTGILLLYRV